MSTQAREHEGRPYRSIREVLDLLVSEYPDMTISKIRFLESRGLIEPERTPSGYRKFYDADIERLRWILRQQREHFLPLKVIKGRLEQGGLFTSEMSLEPSLFDDGGEPQQSSANNGPGESEHVTEAHRPGGGGGDEPPEPPNAPASTRSAVVKAEPATAPRATTAATPSRAARSAASAGAPSATGRASTGERTRSRAKRAVTSVSLSASELAGATGASEQLIADLVEFGLIEARSVGGEQTFSDDAVEITKIAVGFSAFGLEPRHLRSLRNAADRQASTYLQVVAPLLRQRNPAARERAENEMDSLMSLGSRLHDLFVESALRNLL